MVKPTKASGKWHVVVTKTNQYKNSAAILEKLGFPYYLPLQKQLHYWSDRKRWIQVPILSPYIFLFTNESDKKRLFQCSHHFHFLFFGGKPSIAKEEEIERIRLLCDYAVNIKMEGLPPKKGDIVEIVTGPFSGLKGYATQEKGKNRLLIHILSLGQFASVDMDSSWLKVCS
jgi:transcriptional antiterminator RfaH